MGVGKTTVGLHLADLVARPFLDSDDALSGEVAMTGRRYAGLHGVEALHEVELRVFLDAVAATELAVISPAASVVDHPAGRAAMRTHATVWLRASEEVVRTRRGRDDHRRPVDDREATRLRGQRVDCWRSISTLEIDTGHISAREAAAQIVTLLGQERAT